MHLLYSAVKAGPLRPLALTKSLHSRLAIAALWRGLPQDGVNAKSERPTVKRINDFHFITLPPRSRRFRRKSDAFTLLDLLAPDKPN
jgi:hypothetical protein